MSAVLPSFSEVISCLGRGSAAWALPGELQVGHGHWIALTEAMEPDFNLACCSAGDGAQMVGEYMDRLIRHRRPGLLMTTSDLGVPSTVRERGWQRVGTARLMAGWLTDVVSGHTDGPPDARSRALTSEVTAQQIPIARDLMARTFDLTPEAAAVALRPEVLEIERHIWGTFDGEQILACGVSAIDDDCVTLWSVASDTNIRRQGHATSVVRAVLAQAQAIGCTLAVFSAAVTAEPFYLALGFSTLDEISYWSSPRWVLSADIS